MRDSYSGGSHDGHPTVSGDTFTNHATVHATTTPVAGTGESGGQAVHDQSSATQSTAAPTGRQADQAARPGQPVHRRPIRGLRRRNGALRTDSPRPSRRPSARSGPAISSASASRCASRTRSRPRTPVVSDFVPYDTRYVPGSWAVTPGNDVTIADLRRLELVAGHARGHPGVAAGRRRRRGALRRTRRHLRRDVRGRGGRPCAAAGPGPARQPHEGPVHRLRRHRVRRTRLRGLRCRARRQHDPGEGCLVGRLARVGAQRAEHRWLDRRGGLLRDVPDRPAEPRSQRLPGRRLLGARCPDLGRAAASASTARTSATSVSSPTAACRRRPRCRPHR